MSADMFGRSFTYGGSLLPENTLLTNTAGLASGLVTGVRLDYSQQLSRMWSLASGGKVYIVAGDTQGQCDVDELWGTGTGGKPNAGVCTPGTAILSGRNGLCGPGAQIASNASVTMHHCVMNSFGISGSNGNMQIVKSAGMAFIKLT